MRGPRMEARVLQQSVWDTHWPRGRATARQATDFARVRVARGWRVVPMFLAPWDIHLAPSIGRPYALGRGFSCEAHRRRTPSLRRPRVST